MAEDRVDIPIDLTVESIKTGDIDLKGVEQNLSKRVSGIVKSIEGIMGNVDSSKFNKALENSFNAMGKSYDKVQTANARYNDAMRKAGESSEEYKAKLSEVKSEMKAVQDNWNTYNDFMGKSYAGAKEAEASGNLKPHQASLIKMYEEELAQYEQQMQAVQDKMPKPEDYVSTGSETALTNLVQKYKELLKAITATDKAQKDWNQALEANQMSDEYTKKLSELSTYEKKLESVRAKAQKMSTIGASDKSWKSLLYDANLLEQKINQIIAEMQEMVKSGSAFRFDTGDSEKELDSLTNRLNNVFEIMNQIKGAPNTTNTSIKNMDKTLINFCNSAKKGLSKVISMFKKLGKSNNHTSKSMDKSLKRMIKNLASFIFGVKTTYMMIRRLRNTFINSFKEMATQIPDINKQISSFITSINQIKGSLATAFQPIVSAIIPWLNQLIGVLNDAMNAIGRFFATLTGQGYIYKFTAAQVDYAESLDKTGKSAKKAQKSLMGFDEINRLNGDDSGNGDGNVPTGTWETEMLDGMNKLAELIKSAWTDGDFSEVGIYIGEQLLHSLEIANDWITTNGYAVAEKIGKSFATLINGFVSTEGLGTQIGTTIANAFNMTLINLHTFFSTTDWTNVGQFLADWANASIKNFDWSLLGQTFADVIKAAVNTWGQFVGEFDFTALGESISKSINNLFSELLTVDESGFSGAQKLGQSISNTILGIINSLSTLIKETDWSNIGQAIGEVFSSIDWSSIAWDLTKLVGELIKALAEALVSWTDTDPISAALASIIGLGIAGINLAPIITKIAGFGLKLGEVFSLLFGEGQTLNVALKTVFGTASTVFAGVMSIVSGVVIAFTNFFSMLKNGFDWLKEILMVIGIALAAVGAVILGAPAAVAAVVAGIIAAVATLVVVIKDNWNAICDFFKNGWEWLKNAFSQGLEWIKTKWTTIWRAIKTFFANLWTSIKTLVSSAITGIKNVITTVLNAIKTFWTTVWTGIKTTTSNIFNGIKNLISTIITGIKTVITTILNSIKTFWSNTWTGIKTVASTIWSGIKSTIYNTFKGIKTTIATVLGAIKSIWSSLWNGMKTTVSNIWKGISSTIKSSINGIIGSINGMISGTVSGINAIIKALNGLSFEIPDWVPEFGGKEFGFNIKTIKAAQIPYLAKGGVIPPNKEFMAVLGDQKHGTNIEAPLDTIKQAVAEELAEYIDAMMTGFQAVVDAVNDKDLDVRIGDNAIGKAAERYNKRQALVRGTI